LGFITPDDGTILLEGGDGNGVISEHLFALKGLWRQPLKGIVAGCLPEFV
jgi:hypothetical protein